MLWFVLNVCFLWSRIVLVLQSLMDPPIAYNIFFGIIALLSLNMNWFFFCPLILTIVISMSTTLQNVLKAISLSTQQLIMSSLLGLITILIFSFFGFVFFFSFFQDSFNVSPWSFYVIFSMRCWLMAAW